MWNVVQQFAGDNLAAGASGGKYSSAPSFRAPSACFVRSFLLVTLSLFLAVSAGAAEVKLLNVTCEFYEDYNRAFGDYWKAKTGDSVTVNQSHGGSSKQAQAVVNGLEADVVTMNQPLDIDVLQTAGRLIPANWASRLPNKSVPYTSTILFVVRKGNPKHIKNWDDLVQSNVSVVIPNPKTSGNGRYSYLGAWGYALRKSAGDEQQAREFVGNFSPMCLSSTPADVGRRRRLPRTASATCC